MANRNRLLDGLSDAALGALRQNDRARANKMAEQLAAQASALEAKFVLEGREPDPQSYELGGLNVLASLLARANASHCADVQRLLFRRRHVQEILRYLALSPAHTGTPTQLRAKLGIEGSNVSRLIEVLKSAGLVERVLSDTDTPRDGRVYPIRITSSGLMLVDELLPGWRAKAAARARIDSSPSISVLGKRQYLGQKEGTAHRRRILTRVYIGSSERSSGLVAPVINARYRHAALHLAFSEQHETQGVVILNKQVIEEGGKHLSMFQKTLGNTFQTEFRKIE